MRWKNIKKQNDWRLEFQSHLRVGGSLFRRHKRIPLTAPTANGRPLFIALNIASVIASKTSSSASDAGEQSPPAILDWLTRSVKNGLQSPSQKHFEIIFGIVNGAGHMSIVFQRQQNRSYPVQIQLSMNSSNMTETSYGNSTDVLIRMDAVFKAKILCPSVIRFKKRNTHQGADKCLGIIFQRHFRCRLATYRLDRSILHFH
jgi:hypothetical protein